MCVIEEVRRWISVGSTSGRENNPPDSRVNHCVEETKGVHQIIAVIVPWVPHRLPHETTGSEMEHGVNLVFAQRIPQQCRVVQVAYNQWSPFHCPLMPGAQVVICHRQLIRALRGLTSVASDISGSAGY